MDKTFVSIIGFTVIGFIYWFFFGKKEETQQIRTTWNISVEGGYKPATISIPRGKKSTITFTRTDANSCLEDVSIEDFKIKQFLPLNRPVTVTLPPATAGTYGMHCGMNMFHGKIIVV